MQPEVVAACAVRGGCIVFVSILFVGAHDAVVLCSNCMMAMGPAVVANVAKELEVASASKTTTVTAIAATSIATSPVALLV